MIQSNTERGATLVDLCDLRFDNSFVRELPADPLLHNVPRAVRNACYTRVDPTPVPAPQLLAWADPVGEMLGISRPDSPTGSVAEVLGGNRVLAGHAALCSALRRTPVRSVGGTARRRSCHHAGRSGERRTACAMTCSSRARAERRTRAPPTAARCCALRCASSCAARPCIISACRPRGR